MFKRVSPEKDEDTSAGGEKGGGRQLSLLVLLVIVSLFGYLYFFTGLIKPREEAAKSSPEPSIVVKKPIPPRPEQLGGKGKPQINPEEKNGVQGKEIKSAAGVETQKSKTPVHQHVKPVPAKPEPVKTARQEESSAKKAQTQLSPVTAASITSQGKKGAKPAPAVIPGKANKVAEQENTSQKASKPVEKGSRGAYILLIGDFASEEVKKIQTRLEKAAVAPVHKKSSMKVEPMHRLFLADFTDRAAAQAELDKLKKLTADAFILNENGTYAVYAGSYYRKGRAAKEQARFNGQGVKLVLKMADVKVPITKVTAGSFLRKEDARIEAQRLKKLGINAEVVSKN